MRGQGGGGGGCHLVTPRYLLLLDSIRQCEGVAKLLQNSSGKEVPVKPARGNNKVAPGGKNIVKNLENILRFHHSRNARGGLFSSDPGPGGHTARALRDQP